MAAYGSLNRKNPVMVIRPLKMETIQSNHRQPIFSVITPPMMGPTAVPSSGINVDIARECPLCSGLQRSARTGFVTCWYSVNREQSVEGIYGRTANSALAPIPAKKRAAIIVALF